MSDFYNNIKKQYKINGIIYTFRYFSKILQHFLQTNPFYYEPGTPYFFVGILKLRKKLFLLKIILAQRGLIPLISLLQLYKTRTNRVHLDIASLNLFAHSWQFPATQIGVELDAYFFDLLNGFKVGLYFMQSILVFSIYPMLSFIAYFKRNLDFYFAFIYAFVLRSMYHTITFFNTTYITYVILKFYKILKIEKKLALKFRAVNVNEFYEFGWNAFKCYVFYYCQPLLIIFSWLVQPLNFVFVFCYSSVFFVVEYAYVYTKNIIQYCFYLYILCLLKLRKLIRRIKLSTTLFKFFYYLNFFRKVYFSVLYPYFVKYPSFNSYFFFIGSRLFFLILPLLFIYSIFLTTTFYSEIFDYVWTTTKIFDSKANFEWVAVSGIHIHSNLFLSYIYLPLWFFYTLGVNFTYFAQLSPIHLIAFLFLYYISIFYVFDYTHNSANSLKVYFSELTTIDLNDRFKKIIVSLNINLRDDTRENLERDKIQKMVSSYENVEFEENSTTYLDLAYTNQKLLLGVEGLEYYYPSLSPYYSAFSVVFPLTTFTFSALDSENTIEEEFFDKFSAVIVSDLAFEELEEFDIFNTYLVDYDYNEEFDTVERWFQFGEEGMEDEPLYHIPDNLDYNEFSCFPEFFYDESVYDFYLLTVRNFLLPYYYYRALSFANQNAAITTQAQLKNAQNIVAVGKVLTLSEIKTEDELGALFADPIFLPQQDLSNFVRKEMLTESVFALLNFDMQDKYIYYHYDLKLGSPNKYTENFYWPEEILEEDFSYEQGFMRKFKVFDMLPDYIKYSSFHYFLENVHEMEAYDLHTLDSIWDLVKTIGYDPFYGFYEFLEEDDQPRPTYELRVGQNIEYFPELDEYPIERHLPLHMYNMEFFEFDIDAPTNGAFYPETDLSDFSNSGFVKRLADPESYRWTEKSILTEFEFVPTFTSHSKDYVNLFLSSGLARYAEVFSYEKTSGSFSDKQYDFFSNAAVTDPNVFLFDSVFCFGSSQVNNWSQQFFKSMYSQFKEIINIDFDTFPYFASDVMLLEMEDFRDAAVKNIHPRLEFNQLQFISKKDIESDFQFILDNDGFDTYVFNVENEEPGTSLSYAEPIIFRQLLNKTPTRWYRQVVAYAFFMFLNLSAYFKWILPFQTLWFGKTLNAHTKQLFDRPRVQNQKSIFFGEVAQSIWHKGDGLHADHYMDLKPKVLRDPKFRNAYYNYVLGDGFRPLDEWLQSPSKLPMPAVSWLQFRIEYLIVFVLCYFILELVVDFFILKLNDFKLVSKINKIFATPRLFKNPLNFKQYILWSPTNPYYALFLKKLKSVKNSSAKYEDSDSKYFGLYFNYAIKNAFRQNPATYTTRSPTAYAKHASVFDRFGYTFNDTAISVERSHLDFYDQDLALIPDSEYYDVQIPTDYMDFYEDTARFEKFSYYHSLDLQNFVLFNFNSIRFWDKHAALSRDYFGIVPHTLEQFFFTYYLDAHIRERKYFQRLIFKLTTLRDYRAIWYNLQTSRGFFYFNLPNSYFIYPYFSFQKFYSTYRTTKKYKQEIRNVPEEETGLELVGVPGLDVNLKPTLKKSLNLKKIKKKKKIRTLLNLKPKKMFSPSAEIQANILKFYSERGGYLNCYNKERPYFEYMLKQTGIEQIKDSDLVITSAFRSALSYNKKMWLRFYPYVSIYNFYGYNKVNSRFLFNPHDKIMFKWSILHKAADNFKTKNDL